jgi:hypothetical protein
MPSQSITLKPVLKKLIQAPSFFEKQQVKEQFLQQFTDFDSYNSLINQTINSIGLTQLFKHGNDCLVKA